MKNKSTSLVNWLTAATVGLFLLLFALKTYDLIAWSWWWVFAPILVPAALSLVIIVFVLIYIKTNRYDN